jgi:hypothetical protein
VARQEMQQSPKLPYTGALPVVRAILNIEFITHNLIFIYMRVIKMLVVVFVFISLLFVACKPKYPSSYEFSVMSGNEVRRFIDITNNVITMKDPILVDETYAVPTIQWIKSHYTEQLKQFLFDYQLNKYYSVENDCDDFSIYAVTIGHIMHRYAVNKPKRSTLAIGEFHYLHNFTTGHAINFFIALNDKKQIVLVFYEPQTQRIVELNRESIMPVWWKM